MADDTPTSTPDEGQLEVVIDETEKLRQQVDNLEKEKQDTYERLLRTAADLDNFRKRARKDQVEAQIKAREDLLREILPGIDNLERALAAGGSSPREGDANAAAAALLDGVRLVLRQFQSALERFEVKGF